MPNNKPIGIIGAMQTEISALIADMQEVSEETISGIRFVRGYLCGHSVVAACSGVGKVFAAICAQTMILRYQPACILNTGVAGTLGTLSVGQIAIADRVLQHDMDTSAVGDPIGLISGINQIYLPCAADMVHILSEQARAKGLVCEVGAIASGDHFVADTATKTKIVSAFGAIAVEMEGAAIGQVCYVNEVPFCVVRCISDGGDEAASMDYPAFVQMAAERSYRLVEDFLRATC